jgi:hypothetical protein
MHEGNAPRKITVKIAEIIMELEQEVDLRQRTYAQAIGRGALTEDGAYRKLGVMKAALAGFLDIERLRNWPENGFAVEVRL